MSETYQDVNAKQTILQHGVSVWYKFKKLSNHLAFSADTEYPYPMPDWIYEHKDVLLPILQKNMAEIQSYLIYHDCGKPFCLTEQDGKRHFPNHAEISKATFLKYHDSEFIAELIGNDMLCHVTKPKDYKDIINTNNIEILLCASLSELHSNALMFGGFDSDSFKIKFKNLSKLGNRILNEKYNLN